MCFRLFLSTGCLMIMSHSYTINNRMCRTVRGSVLWFWLWLQINQALNLNCSACLARDRLCLLAQYDLNFKLLPLMITLMANFYSFATEQHENIRRRKFSAIIAVMTSLSWMQYSCSQSYMNLVLLNSSKFSILSFWQVYSGMFNKWHKKVQ